MFYSTLNGYVSKSSASAPASSPDFAELLFPLAPGKFEDRLLPFVPNKSISFI